MEELRGRVRTEELKVKGSAEVIQRERILQLFISRICEYPM